MSAARIVGLVMLLEACAVCGPRVPGATPVEPACSSAGGAFLTPVDPAADDGRCWSVELRPGAVSVLDFLVQVLRIVAPMISSE